MTTAWKELKHELMASTSRDFERSVFPWLRLRTPELVLPSELKDLDKKGADMAFVTPGKVFPLVVQCKGFEVTVDELGTSQIGQVAKSIDSFLKSGLKCVEYVLLFNRGGNNRSFAKDARQELNRLETAGCAATAKLWSLDDLIKELNHVVTRKIVDALITWSQRIESQRPRLFSFDDVVIENVPAVGREWSLNRGASVGVLEQSRPLQGSDLREKLLQRSEGQYSLVIGSYGIGKTTLMRNFRLPPGFARVLVPAGALTIGGVGESTLLQNMLRYTGCLDDLSDQTTIDLKRLERIGSTCLADKLQSGEAKIILIIDGLDENRMYARPDGFLLLANELGRMRVPVVLTTRKEHFFNSFQDLQPDQQKTWLSRSVKASVVELGEWQEPTCRCMIERIASQSEHHQKAIEGMEEHLQPAIRQLVFSHPLWLAMTIDLALCNENGLFETPAQLYGLWTEQKYLRDISSPLRHLPASLENSAVFVRTMDAIMQRVAAEMCSTVDGRLQLSEEISEEAVNRVARDVIKSEERLDPLYAQTSLLMPTSVRTARTPLRFRFSHYSFQEFYTAQALEAGLVDGKQLLPEGVRSFLQLDTQMSHEESALRDHSRA